MVTTGGDGGRKDNLNWLMWNNERGHHMYHPKGAKIYHDIFRAMQSGIIEKVGNPSGWNDKAHRVNKWHRRTLLRIGGGANSNGNGLRVHVPRGKNVLWIRVSNHVWATFRIVHEHAQRGEEQEVYACGHRKLNEYSPDGGAPDTYWDWHQWCQFPLRHHNGGAVMVYTDRHCDGWISGVAFSTNPWGHARNSGVAYHWALNGGTPLTSFSHNWNNDHIANLLHHKVWILKVPVVPNGYDKLLYFIEHINNWHGTMHGDVYVNERKVERFRTSYGGNNPFANHYNSKLYDRYMALRVPRDLIEWDAKFLEVKVDMTNSNHHIHIREAGTHDYV
jgi:hypothetical protein